MLKINNLSASIGNKQILNNVNIELAKGKCLLVTGQNGAGKSTLLHAIMGRPDITTVGHIDLDGVELHTMECHERAKAGVFLAHQSPPTIDGVNTMTLFKEIHKVQNILTMVPVVVNARKMKLLKQHYLKIKLKFCY